MPKRHHATSTEQQCPRRPAQRAVVRLRAQAGKVRAGILLWALGVPIPIILVIFLVRGCA